MSSYCSILSMSTTLAANERVIYGGQWQNWAKGWQKYRNARTRENNYIHTLNGKGIRDRNATKMESVPFASRFLFVERMQASHKEESFCVYSHVILSLIKKDDSAMNLHVV